MSDGDPVDISEMRDLALPHLDRLAKYETRKAGLCGDYGCCGTAGPPPEKVTKTALRLALLRTLDDLAHVRAALHGAREAVQRKERERLQYVEAVQRLTTQVNAQHEKIKAKEAPTEMVTGAAVVRALDNLVLEELTAVLTELSKKIAHHTEET